VAGWGAGAGDADATDIGMLAHDGYEPIALWCSDVVATRGAGGRDCFVVASEEDAYVFLEWPEAEGKHILALTDYLDEAAWAIRAADSGFRDFMDEVTDAVPPCCESSSPGLATETVRPLGRYGRIKTGVPRATIG
jgi:hypothetical protein